MHRTRARPPDNPRIDLRTKSSGAAGRIRYSISITSALHERTSVRLRSACRHCSSFPRFPGARRRLPHRPCNLQSVVKSLSRWFILCTCPNKGYPPKQDPTINWDAF
ncbi:uncharacterized protein LOC143183063 [Calliopsis andreniformis]|uniref:uncharacterized protein LOC143183063 n=1 Tax=Calliopsis andreniformis TaxID=337506 RepID=UPI003FCCD1F9